ncbi:MAG TPA: NRDE family protein [Gemmatimonadales bacterium]|nr:NRDE family protein [Gemmatimonadales bacterium]
MCLVLVGLDAHPEYALIIAANRDEFYDRPTSSAEFWADAPSVLAGRDLKAGGSWLGIDRRGRFAAVTNYRQGRREHPGARSRGQLVSDFLTTDVSAVEHMERARREAGTYNGFNLLAFDSGGLFYFSNRAGQIRRLSGGVYGLSNHLLDTPWPKVIVGKGALDRLLRDAASDLTSELFALLLDCRRLPDALLPSTGIGPEWERLLSSAFIVSESYGTRSSTVVLVGRDGSVLFVERIFGPGGVPGSEAQFEFQIEPSSIRDDR